MNNFLGVIIIASALVLRSSKPFQNLMIIGMVFGVTTTVTAGFFIPYYQIPTFVQTFTFLNFMRVQLESMILILFKGRCETIPILYNSYGINESQLSTNVYFLIIEGIILRLIALIVLLLRTNSISISQFFRKNKNS